MKGSAAPKRLKLLTYKCTKHKFIHLFTATFKGVGLHIENGKHYKR